MCLDFNAEVCIIIFVMILPIKVMMELVDMSSLGLFDF